MCNALITWTTPGPVVCPLCHNALETGTSDPTGHWLSEIDPDLKGGGFGACHVHLIPPGTKVCAQCRHVYPKIFECCPKLVDLALAEYGHAAPDWGPKTRDRIVEFLKKRPVVVENTIKLRLLQAEDEELDSEIADQIRFYAKSVGLPYVVSETNDGVH